MSTAVATRIYASLCHLAASACIVLLAGALVFYGWYPGDLANLSGAAGIFVMLVGIDLVLGPSITLLIFDVVKKPVTELKRDVLVVVMLQLAALVYGLNALFVARPAYVVFNSGQFDLVFANELMKGVAETESASPYSDAPFFGPVLVAAQLPEQADIAAKLVMNAVAGGADVQNIPALFVPYESQQKSVRLLAKPLSELNDRQQKLLGEVLPTLNTTHVGYLRLVSTAGEAVVLISKETGEVLKYASIFEY